MGEENGGPAFPVSESYNASGEPMRWSGSGMSLRDWFAATLDVDNIYWSLHEREELAGPKPPNEAIVEYLEWELKALAKMRYMYADAMLRAREGEE